MTNTAQKARDFKSLHHGKAPLVLYNIWDAGSAKIVADAGARALATSSFAAAAAHNYQDGESLPLDIAMNTLSSIVCASNLPVTVDLESGYGAAPAQISNVIKRALKCGAVGFNLEDQIISQNKLYSIAAQSARLAACRTAAKKTGVPAFINARTDIFLQAVPSLKQGTLFDTVLERAHAYHKAGADGFFVPGLIDKKVIGELCKLSPLPINIMVMPNCPDIETLTNLGVSRISYGPGPYLRAMNALCMKAKSLYTPTALL